MPLGGVLQGEMLRSLGANGAKVKRAGGTEVNGRAESAWNLSLILLGASHRRATIFFLQRQFASHMFARKKHE